MKRRSKKKNSTKILFAVAIVAALIFVISSYFISHKNDVVIAKVNNTKILKTDVELKLREVFEMQGQVAAPEIDKLPKEVLEILVKEIYLEKQLTAEAAKSKAVKTKEVKEKILAAKERILRQAYINSLLTESVTDEKVNAKFEEMNNEIKGKKEYSVAHIVVKTKAEAEKIEKELKSKPTKFSDLAKKYSIDTESANNGGDLGYVIENNMIKEISDTVSKLQKDEISAPVETKFGWHIIKVLDIRDAEALSLDSVKENIRDQLVQDKINDINSGITKDAKIEILIQLKEPEQKPAAENNSEEKVTLETAAEGASKANEESAAKEEKAADATEEAEQKQTDTKQTDEHKKHKKHHKKSR
jgi:parvulin-like peptidyl-prolyl isomerase